jgi:hypothetical protein
MFGAERLFADCQRALMKSPRRWIFALVIKQAGEDVDAPCRVEMVGAEHLFTDRQRGSNAILKHRTLGRPMHRIRALPKFAPQCRNRRQF